jgi:hypothetical protein
MQFIFEAPINSLSFGNVAVNLLREMWKAGHEVGLFPIGNNADASAHTIDPEFSKWIQNSIDGRFDLLKKDIPTIKLWHLNGSENRKTKEQYLLSFYECSQPTKVEKTLVDLQTKTFLSSAYSVEKFENVGCDNVKPFTLGFDPSFNVTGKKYLPGRIHFGLMGKFEHRKHTAKIIKTWLERYGNNPKYLLSCCITNPFFKEDQMKSIIASTLEGKQYSNINFLPYLKSNAEVNDFMNAIDIDLTGLSGAEGWNLPSFNATCLGKWSVVLNATSHKDWANSENSILVEPSSTIPIYDGVFFNPNQPFNQGVMFDWSKESAIEAFEAAEKKIGETNESGLLLGKSFTYEKTLNQILSEIK